MSDFEDVPFGVALVVLKREVLLVGDVHTLIDWLLYFMGLVGRFRGEDELKREQEAVIMYDVCKDELARRGCEVEVFGDFDV